jgi:DNA/RNA-binding domain of Phe-tRNA-synthetase-like protein
MHIGGMGGIKWYARYVLLIMAAKNDKITQPIIIRPGDGGERTKAIPPAVENTTKKMMS